MNSRRSGGDPAPAPTRPPDRALTETDTVIVGAGPAGLAAASCLVRVGARCVILELANRIAPAWHRHYDCLHLHTPKQHSALPFVPFPAAYPTYPSRLQMIEYLEAYAQHFGLSPRLGERVVSVRRRGDRWETSTETTLYLSRNVVVASGLNARPNTPHWPGQEDYRGTVLHSREYRNGEPFRGARVLVVGFGNSGGEIAIDLFAHGARPALAIRGPVNVIARDLLGIPTVSVVLALRFLPPRALDAIAAPLRRLVLGDLTQYGLRRGADGPATQIATRARIPLIDVGTIDLIKRGCVAVRPGIERFTPSGVRFTDRTSEDYDAVVLATGYRPGLGFLTDGARELAADPMRLPREGREAPLPGLFFSGFHVPTGGTLREIGIETRNIARQIAAKAAGGA